MSLSGTARRVQGCFRISMAGGQGQLGTLSPTPLSSLSFASFPSMEIMTSGVQSLPKRINCFQSTFILYHNCRLFASPSSLSPRCIQPSSSLCHKDSASSQQVCRRLITGTWIIQSGKFPLVGTATACKNPEEFICFSLPEQPSTFVVTIASLRCPYIECVFM